MGFAVVLCEEDEVDTRLVEVEDRLVEVVDRLVVVLDRFVVVVTFRAKTAA